MNISIVDAVRIFYQKYTDFAGRATRAEYWYVFLYSFVVSGILGFISEYASYAFALVNLIPGIAISVRRMHDIGKSGWWVLISLIPIIGTIWYIILTVKPSEGPNQYNGAYKA